MKLYTAPRAPNPRAIDWALHLKKIEVERVEIDLLEGENRGDEFLKINPAGQLPALVTDEGLITEITAMIEYFEELKPDPVLVGATAQERAETRMWARRADIMVILPMANGFRHGKAVPFFTGRIPIYEDISAPSQSMANDGLAWFNTQLADGRDFLCGKRFSYADIVFVAFVAYFAKVAHPIDDYPHVIAYIERVLAYEGLGEIK